jgi:hypothetical protein
MIEPLGSMLEGLGETVEGAGELDRRRALSGEQDDRKGRLSVRGRMASTVHHARSSFVVASSTLRRPGAITRERDLAKRSLAGYCSKM